MFVIKDRRQHLFCLFMSILVISIRANYWLMTTRRKLLSVFHRVWGHWLNFQSIGLCRILQFNKPYIIHFDPIVPLISQSSKNRLNINLYKTRNIYKYTIPLYRYIYSYCIHRYWTFFWRDIEPFRKWRKSCAPCTMMMLT